MDKWVFGGIKSSSSVSEIERHFPFARCFKIVPKIGESALPTNIAQNSSDERGFLYPRIRGHKSEAFVVDA